MTFSNDYTNIDNCVTFHQRNLQVLTSEIYKAQNNLSPKFMQSIFKTRYVHTEARALKTNNLRSIKN